MSTSNGKTSDPTRTVRAEYAGEEHKHLLCLWGLMLAEQKGFDVSSIELDEDVEERKGDVQQMGELLWIARLPFEEDLTLKELGMSVSFGDMEAVAEAFQKITSRQITSDVREHVEKQGSKKKG